MTIARMLRTAAAGMLVVPAASIAQVPDLVTAFDAGGRAMGAGGSLYQTSSDTLASVYNPAGLGYLDRGSMQLAVRNLPTTETAVTGTLDDLRLNSRGESGDLSVGHLGIAMPLRSGMGSGGAWSIAWTVAGYLHDRQSGTNLGPGIATYDDFIRAKTDFITLGYGRSSASKGFSWGINLIYALQNVRNLQEITFEQPGPPPQIADSDSNGNGVGATVGFMFIPPGKANVTFGVSARTPIEVQGDGSALSLYDRIPGRISAGLAFAEEGMRGGKDSIIYGISGDYFFGGKNSPRIDRENQFAAGIGLEYQYQFGDAVIPFRLGYRAIQAGGEDFDDRSGPTFGIGYRPNHGNWTIELNFGNPQGGGSDFSMAFTYRFGK